MNSDSEKRADHLYKACLLLTSKSWFPIRPHAALKRKNDPSPEEIERRAAEVRAGWSDAERYSRWRGRSDSKHSTEGVEAAAKEALAHKLTEIHERE